MKKWLNPALLIFTFCLVRWDILRIGTSRSNSFCRPSRLFLSPVFSAKQPKASRITPANGSGILNATFGNAAELIIAILLIKEGLYDMVKASITGSIIGNLLLVLGLSLFAGGLKFKIQKYNVTLAGLNGSLMTLAIIALFIPAVFLNTHSITEGETKTLSLIVAGILIVAYIAWLGFSMITHKIIWRMSATITTRMRCRTSTALPGPETLDSVPCCRHRDGCVCQRMACRGA